MLFAIDDRGIPGRHALRFVLKGALCIFNATRQRTRGFYIRIMRNTVSRKGSRRLLAIRLQP